VSRVFIFFVASFFLTEFNWMR